MQPLPELQAVRRVTDPADNKERLPYRGERTSKASLLPVGFHPTDLEALRRLVVDYFPRSLTRPRLMMTVETIHDLVNQTGMPARIWIGGEIMTEEENPEACDITLVLVTSVFAGLTPEQREFFDWFRTAALYEKYRCSNYGIVMDAERDDFEPLYSYWVRQYGFGREGRTGGVAELLVPSLVRNGPTE